MPSNEFELHSTFDSKLDSKLEIRRELLDSIKKGLKPINYPYSGKLSEFDPVWIEELSYKNSILGSEFEALNQEEFYADLLGSVDAQCDLLLDRKYNRSGVKFDELPLYIQENHNVFIYTQSFDTYFRGTPYPKTYEALQNWYAIVVDVDDVRADHLESLLIKIKTANIKPKYILSTGGGLQLYYMLSQPHNIKGSIGIIAYSDSEADDEIKQLLTHEIGYHKSYLKFLDPYHTIKEGMIAWFSDTPVISDTQNHLAQPSRLLGSKTKNPKHYVKGYKAFDVEYNMQELALLFGIELPDESDIGRWVGISKKAKSDADKKRRAEKTSDKKLRKENSAVSSIHIADQTVDCISPDSLQTSGNDFIDEPIGSIVEPENSKSESKLNMKHKFDWTQMSQRILGQQIRDREYLKKKKLERAERNKSANAQALGRLSMYRQFKNWILKIGNVGNRTGCLISFWHRSHQYIKDEQMIERDYYDIAWRFQMMSRTNVLTDADVASIKRKTPDRIRNTAIKKLTGHELKKFERKQETERADSKTKTASKKAIMLETITMTAKEEFELSGKLSYAKLSEILKEKRDTVRSPKTLSLISAVREIKGDPPLSPATKKEKE